MHGGSVPKSGRVANLSRSGCFMETHDPLATGELVYLHLSLPVGGSMSVKGEVVHRQRRGFGVRFVELTRENQEAVAQTLAHLSATDQ